MFLMTTQQVFLTAGPYFQPHSVSQLSNYQVCKLIIFLTNQE